MTPVFTSKPGAVYWRGYYKRPEDCADLLALFKNAAREPGNPFASTERALYLELYEAMQAAGYLEPQEAAA